jgi:ornithine cyclodeaminase
VDVQATPAAKNALHGADVVVTATTSPEPVLKAAWLAHGATVITVGSFTPDRRELGEDVMRAADVVVADHPATALNQCGALLRGLHQGALRPADVQSLGAVLVGQSPGRRSPADLVVYASVGLGIQDAAAAWLVLERSQTEAPPH